MTNLNELKKEELREVDGGGWFWGDHYVRGKGNVKRRFGISFKKKVKCP